VVLNDLDRFHLALDTLARVPGLGDRGEAARQMLETEIARHNAYIREHGEDMPAVREWRWPVDVPDSSTRP